MFARHAGNGRLGCPRYGRQEKEAEKLILHKQRVLQKCSQFVIHNWLQAFREQRKKVVFACKVCHLSDSTSKRIWLQNFQEWAFVNVQNCNSKPIVHFVPVCLFFFFFFFSNLRLHCQFIHLLWFASLNTLLIQCNLEVLSSAATSCPCWMSL